MCANGVYKGPLKVRVLAQGVSGEDGPKRKPRRTPPVRPLAGRCPNGHLYTDETTSWVKNGRREIVRRCLVCDRERKKRYREAAKKP